MSISIRPGKPPTDKKWYHGEISREEAKRRLRTACDGYRSADGAYLVYDNPIKSNAYILIAMKGGTIYSFDIFQRRDNGQYALDSCVHGHPTVRLLVKTHRGLTGKPIRTASGTPVLLSHSYVKIEDYCY